MRPLRRITPHQVDDLLVVRRQPVRFEIGPRGVRPTTIGARAEGQSLVVDRLPTRQSSSRPVRKSCDGASPAPDETSARRLNARVDLGDLWASELESRCEMWIIVAAWSAAFLVFSSFFMKTIVPLRIVAM